MLDRYYNQIYYYVTKDNDIKEGGKLLNVFKDSRPVNELILDIGCGPGVTLTSLAKNNKIIGLDIIDRYLEIARRNGYHTTVKCNIENGLPFTSSSFDIIVCTDLIEHIFDTEFVGKEIRRVLKNNGYAILNVPNHNELYRRMRFLFGLGINVHKIEDWNYFHIRFFTWKSWQDYLNKLGFHIFKFYGTPSKLSRYIRLPTILAEKFPNLFSSNFLVKVKKF